VIYIGSGDDRVYALNAATGTKLWSYHTGNQVFSSPTVANGGGLRRLRGWQHVRVRAMMPLVVRRNSVRPRICRINMSSVGQDAADTHGCRLGCARERTGRTGSSSRAVFLIHFQARDSRFQIVEFHRPNTNLKHLAGCTHFACSCRGRIGHHSQQRVDRGWTSLLEAPATVNRFEWISRLFRSDLIAVTD
jgi:PQQ enzyme repeat